MGKAVVLCEGSHDHLGLAWALRCRGWQSPTREAYKSDWEWARMPLDDDEGLLAVSRSGDRLLLRSFGGIDNLITARGDDFLRLALGQVTACCLIVDSDTSGVEARRSLVQRRLGSTLGLQGELIPGGVVAGRVPVGLWIAPDNQRSGTIDELLVSALHANRPLLGSAASRFVQGTPDFAHPARASKYASKALLGAAAQASHPGRSLAQALREPEPWLAGAAGAAPELDAVADFLERLLQP